MPPATTTSCGRPESSFCRFLALGNSWGDVFGDRVIASAILDRILHHATTISIRGDSYRLKDKLKSGVVKPTTAGA